MIKDTGEDFSGREQQRNFCDVPRANSRFWQKKEKKKKKKKNEGVGQSILKRDFIKFRRNIGVTRKREEHGEKRRVEKTDRGWA